ncbi:hypothetical protein GCM10010220_66230 [Streptomyces parvulus]|nr:hypothetical protein GCM10010220_66230 [Streptomyces parvulus]
MAESGNNTHDASATATASPRVMAVRFTTSSIVITVVPACRGEGALLRLTKGSEGLPTGAGLGATASPSAVGALLRRHCMRTGFELFRVRVMVEAMWVSRSVASTA